MQAIISDVVRKGYIYGLFADDEPILLWECRYIGKTGKVPFGPTALADRLYDHESGARRGKQDYRSRWIRSVWERGAKIVIKPFEVYDGTPDILNPLLDEREKVWIAEGRRQGWRLTNLTDGGEGIIGYSHSEETKRKIAESNRGQKRDGSAWIGRKHSPEARAKMSASKQLYWATHRKPPVVGRGRPPHGEEHVNARLTEEDVKLIRKMAAEGVQQKEIADQFGIIQQNVSKIVLRKSWKHVD